MNKLYKESVLIKKEANNLLNSCNLLNSFYSCKNIYVRGSYELDLMVAKDIDIYVVGKNINRGFSIKILNKFIKENKFNGYIYYDYSKAIREGFPKGYYIGLKTFYNNNWWKIDIWLINKMDKKSDNFMKYIKENIDDNKKKIILKLKYYSQEKKMNIPSYAIYNAVIKHGVRSIMELNKFMKEDRDY